VSPIQGLYAITPDEPDTQVLLRKVRQALEGGARLLQYRNKAADGTLRLAQGRALRALTREFGALLIVNDDAGLAHALDADGVHLGGEDGPAAAARALLGPGKIIGVSCYNQPSLASAAIANGADYVAFGAFFPSAVKPQAVTAGVEMLRAARADIGAPVVAIGGITARNGGAVVAAGADALAVISGVFDAPDIRAAAREFTALFERNSAP
jgi:thiamine-phosphate pyrophosphorylase